MAVLHQFDYIFAIGMIFAFLDAWNIGANDVANSFATSVSSRSLTLKQAMMIASVMEFAGAVLVGSRVADTIRNKILDVTRFESQPAVLMLGMMCALIGSSTWLSVATRMGLPVSTTHCIVGGVIGVGIATLGGNGVVWGWKGVSQVFAAWFIAPCIAGAFGVIIFTVTKYAVLKRKDSLRAGLWMIPAYFAITSGILTMVIVWKGAPSLDLDDWTGGQIAGCVLGVAFGVVALYGIFLLPFLHRRLVQEDWTLKSWEVLKGPLLWRRGPVPPKPEGYNKQVVQDYYRGHSHPTQMPDALTHNADIDARNMPIVEDAEKNIPTDEIRTNNSDNDSQKSPEKDPNVLPKTGKPLDQIDGKWYKPSNLLARAKYYFFHGVNIDVVAEQLSTTRKSRTSWLTSPTAMKHAQNQDLHYDNKTEHLYSFLQVLTCAVASFAHGSNDVSNAIGPLSAIFLIWSSGTLASRSPVPVWVLVYGGAAIVIGLWTYGYNIMRNLGNRLTLHSPSRGFSMELGSAVTVILATRLGLPISTTQCIIGATVGVGLASGSWRAINWRMVAWSYLGWVITLPVAGIISGCLMGIIINAPEWSGTPAVLRMKF